jgi:hypothetical protein
MKHLLYVTTLAALGAFSPLSALAQQASASGELSLQGRLTTTSGQAVTNGEHRLAISLYARGTGQLAYSETDLVTTVDGIFSTTIGDNGSSALTVESGTEYEIGISVDNGTELSPRLRITDALSSIRADVAANAEAVGGFKVGNGGSAEANTLVVLDANGRIPASTLGGSVVTGVNGMRGDVTIQGGGGLNVTSNGNAINLSFTGGGGGSFNLPYSQSVDIGSGQSALSLTSTGAGTAAAFINSSTGAAVRAQSTAGAAIHATTSTSASAAIEAENSVGTAVSVVSNSTADAALRIRNTSSAVQAKLISATSANASAAFEVAANGQTTIRSTVGNALDVSTSATGEAALKLTGGLLVNGPAGVGTITKGGSTVTISNTFARANSIILVTVRSGVDALPVRIASQGDGQFSVSLINSLAGTLTGDLSFNYLIINQ